MNQTVNPESIPVASICSERSSDIAKDEALGRTGLPPSRHAARQQKAKNILLRG